MTRLMLDTNVVLDLLLDRAPFATAAAALFDRVESGAIDGLLCAATLTTVQYLAARSIGRTASVQAIRDLLTLFEVAPVHRSVIERALVSPITDFEDAVLAESAALAGAQAIVTRNARDFRPGALPVYTPDEWLALPL